MSNDPNTRNDAATTMRMNAAAKASWKGVTFGDPAIVRTPAWLFCIQAMAIGFFGFVRDWTVDPCWGAK